MSRPKRVVPERQLTELELELMQTIWACGECTVRDVHDALPKKLAYTTIATVMKVLEQKGFLSIQKHEKAHVYQPTLSREAYARGALKHVTEQIELPVGIGGRRLGAREEHRLGDQQRQDCA